MNNSLFDILIILGFLCTVINICLLIYLAIRLIFSREKSLFSYKKTIITTLVIFFLTVIFWLNILFNTNFFPQGYLSQEVYSINQTYIAEVYQFSGFIDYKYVKVDIYNIENGNKETIFFDYVDKSLDIKWLEDNIIQIEGINLKVGIDKHDIRIK